MHYRSNTVDPIYEESNTVDPIYEESNTVDPIYEGSNTVDSIYEEMDTAEYEEMTVLQENIPTTDCTAYVAIKATASATPDYENTNF